MRFFLSKNNSTTTEDAEDTFNEAMEIPGYKSHMKILLINTVAAAAIVPPKLE